jgi:hypothetical protein
MDVVRDAEVRGKPVTSQLEARATGQVQGSCRVTCVSQRSGARPVNPHLDTLSTSQRSPRAFYLSNNK